MMRTTLMMFSLLLTTCLSATIDPSTIYTVVAKSGLSMRLEPNVDAARVTIIPFGAQVQLLTDEPYSQDTEKINGRTGFWADVRYEGKEGYVFSAYLWSGTLNRMQEEPDYLQSDYRIMTSGTRCEDLNYDPDWHWYGWFINGEEANKPTLELRPVELTIEMGDDNAYYTNDGPFCELLTLEHSNLERYPFLTIGTKTELPYLELNKIGKTHLSEGSYYSPFGWLPFPFQNVVLETVGSTTYYLSGKQTHFLHEELQQWMTRYELYFGPYALNPYDEYAEDHQLLSEQLYVYDLDEEYFYDDGRGYLYHPKIVWQADLNGDGMVDLLFHRPDTSESCGATEEYYLLVSERSLSGKYTYRKVAEEMSSDCM